MTWDRLFAGMEPRLELVGLDVDDARRRAAELGIVDVRVIEDCHVVTLDLSPARLNLAVKDRRVTHAGMG